jgi:acyl-CoA reductase-like NAD-dependent aldehyde dehydrogenase
MIASGTEQQRSQAPAEGLSAERIAHLEGLVSQAKAAVFTQFTQEDVDRIVKPMVLAGLEQAQYLARLAIEETRLGVMEDKVIKNMVATEFTYNYVKGQAYRWRHSRVS